MEDDETYTVDEISPDEHGNMTDEEYLNWSQEDAADDEYSGE